ncbi:MAG: fibrobacter succinogenes major paralogous domain-containing protein [Fibromonadales bacterium]|nr:fibrobacter succinogenes major paralogous domain-containing protein [Fibromonadales bacterium]
MRKLLFTAFATIAILGCSNNDYDELPCISCAAKEAGCPNVTTGNNTLSCGGKTYKTVVIGSQTWMAENLNYNAAGSKCYGNNGSNCQRYGRLYDWFIAKKSCPKGWHLPSNADWDKLVNYVESSNRCRNCAAKYLKTSDWNGNDKYGFFALPGGYGYSGGDFNYVGYGGWWSASERFSDDAYYMYMFYDGESVYWNDDDKYNLFSVRCVQD